MALSSGARLGPYQVLELIGAGGMGEVYRGRDVRLDRTVAIKVLPPHVVSDAESRLRFEREAKAVAALSHPHICRLYDVGNSPNPDSQDNEPVLFLVMEYLEGTTLADVLRKKALPLDQVLRIALQIAGALDSAHRSGIIHRDLKPGNIILTTGGAKLLDFGLAKVKGTPTGDVGAAATVTAPLTARGTILGTLQYMSPEQVEGRDADHRSDLFSFGSILYEMTTGTRAFEGSSAASVMAAILGQEPMAMRTRQPLSPPLLDHLVRQCLAKNPDERWQSAGDVMRALTWITETRDETTEPAGRDRRGRRRERVAWISAMGVLSIVTLLTMVAARRPASHASELRLEIPTPPTFDPFSLAISPDGETVVFVANSGGRPQLWLRALNGLDARPLRGTDNPQLPFWSPDSRSIGFAASGQLKRIDLDGQTVRRLANAPLFLGGSWNTDGTIVFVPNTNTSVCRVPDSGGDPVAVTPLQRLTSHHFPQMLPDGRHFLYYVAGGPESRGVYVGQVDGTSPRRLLPADAAATYEASGHLLFVRQGALLAQRFDPARQELSGTASPVVDDIATGGFAGATLVAVSASAAGPIVYRSGAAGLGQYRFEFSWVGRSGTALEKVTRSFPVALNPSLSPDERRVAMFMAGDIYIFDLGSGIPNRLTLDPMIDFAGVWSPDGGRIAFASNRKGEFDLYQKDATGAGGDELLLETPGQKIPTDWSLDGKFLLYRSLDAKTSFDIWALSMADRKPFPVVQTPHEERDAVFSPDGRWIAYQSNESGRFEIWVRPFPFPGTEVKGEERWQFSSEGGTRVRWGRTGNEIFFLALDGTLVAVPVEVQPGGRAVAPGRAVPLFSSGAPVAFGGGTALPSYMVSRDRQRFLMSTAPQLASTIPIKVLVNWKPKS